MYYLKEDVYFEPLFNQWYAWSYLLSPVTCARHLHNTHRRIMMSFIKNHKLHILASKDKHMAGGEFLDCTEEQLTDIQRLIDDIDTNCQDMLALSNGVKALDEVLRLHTSGESLESLYKEVPEALKGYVELCFDLNHNPSFRLLEGLLYKSPYYKKQLQKVSFGLLSRVEQRPFVLSTPRLPDDNHIQVNLDFCAPQLDVLLQARQNPLSKAQIDEIFAPLDIRGGLDYMDLFTEKVTDYPHQPVKDGLRVEYTGHAGFLLETPDVAILVDPVIASRKETYADEVISFSQLPDKIDYLCITHNHTDHVNIETLLQLRYKTELVLVPKNNGGGLADPSLRLLLKQLNFNVIEVDDMDEFIFKGGKITSLPFLGEHGDLNIRSKTAWLMEIDSKKIVFAADSANLEPKMYQHIHKLIGDIDILAIGLECVGAPYTWIYGALQTQMVSKSIKNSRRLNGANAEQASQLSDILKPKSLYIYALGLEPWYKYFMGIEYDEESAQIVESRKLLDICQQQNIEAESLYGKKTINF